MAQLRHIALCVEDAEETAAFYKGAFGMKEVFRQRNDEIFPKWAIYLTDGYINMALLPIKHKRPIGIDHFGFAVDDLDAGLKTALAAGGLPPDEEKPRDGRQAETMVYDPAGNVRIDLAREWHTSVPKTGGSIDTSTAAVKA